MIRYIVNLDRSVDRWNRMQALFQDLGLDVVRLPAVDGRKKDPEELRNMRPTLSERHFWLKEMTPGEMGCYLSHLKAWNALLETKDEWALIMEDDLFVRENAKDFISDESWIPEGVDLIQMTASKEPAEELREKDFKMAIGKDARLVKVLKWGNMGTVAYMINRKGAAAMISISKKILGPVDDLLFLHASPVRKEIDAWGLAPAVFYFDDDLESEIGLEKKNNKTPKLANPVGYLERKLIMMKHKAKCSREGVKDHR